MASENPIQELYDIYIKLIQGTTIKYSYLADSYEDLEMRKYVDGYLDAYYKRDTFDLYEYTNEEYVKAGVEEPELAIRYSEHPDEVPKSLKEAVLEIRRQSIIDNYIEKNEYYRMINGQPPLNDDEFIYVDYWTAIENGINPGTPIHLIEDEQGTHYINALESIGYLTKVQEENPDKEYLKYLGSRRVKILDARRAKNFEILYIDSSISESVRNLFTTLYEQCREYFMTTIYIYEYRKVIDYYDRFIALCIMVMALQQLTARTITAAIDRDFLDSHAIKMLYEAYDIPFYSKLDEKTQKAICQNINLLIRNKGTNKVIYDIASLLGFNRIDIYKYYLIKEHRMDAYGNPLFVTKKEFNENTGKEEEVYDEEMMYDVYFQKVLLNDYDYHEALEDPSNRVGYDSVTSADPFWVEDSDLYKDVWESEYNYKETKYLGVTVSYKLSEMLYENILLMRMIFDNKEGLEKITLKLPSITGDVPIPLFDVVVFLCALVSKKYGLKGEIVSKPSQVISVTDSLNRMYRPYETMNETFAFNFKWFTDEHYQEARDQMFQYMTESEIKEFENYISILTITGSTNEQKIKAINDMYTNIKGLSKFLAYKMSLAKSIEEYQTYQTFFRAIYYSKETDEMFTVYPEDGSPRTAKTFNEYLGFINPTLKDFVDNCEREDCSVYIDHTIGRMEEIIADLKYLYLINNATSTIQEILIDLIRFFKSYTTDMIGLNIVYIFDFTPDNFLRLFDKIQQIKKKIGVNDKYFYSWADSIVLMKERMGIDEKLCFSDVIRVAATIHLEDFMHFEDWYRVVKTLEETDYLKLIDEIMIKSKIDIFDYIDMRDKIVKVNTKAFLSDILKWTEELILSKKMSTKDAYMSYDTIGNILSTITHEETNMQFSDTCFVVRN